MHGILVSQSANTYVYDKINNLNRLLAVCIMFQAQSDFHYYLHPDEFISFIIHLLYMYTYTYDMFRLYNAKLSLESTLFCIHVHVLYTHT